MKRVLLFLVMQIVLIFVLTEILARILDPAGISYYPETASLLDQMIIEEPIGYRFPPNMSGRFHGVHVQTNSLGLRDREIPTIKSPAEYRILMMGDSVVFGMGVEFEDSIPFQLEHLLNQEAGQDRRYRTVNMGVPSYNTEQELIQLRDVGLSLEPDLVLLFFIPNDIEPKMWVFEKRRNPAADLAQRSYAASLHRFSASGSDAPVSRKGRGHRRSGPLPDRQSEMAGSRSISGVHSRDIADIRDSTCDREHVAARQKSARPTSRCPGGSGRNPPAGGRDSQGSAMGRAFPGRAAKLEDGQPLQPEGV